jgi:hypothetical protein
MRIEPQRRLRAAAAIFLGMVFLSLESRPCTLALVSAGASGRGRALMWKNRDASDVDNKLMYFSGPKYAFIGLVNASDNLGRSVWGGLNTAGFAIMNSLAGDLATEGPSGGGNGVLMKLALGECATVRDFEALLSREKGKYALAANFGVLDAEGNACFFETGRDGFQKFDASDPRVAPFGYLVRTNFAFSSPDLLQGGGFIRFERISHIMEATRGSARADVRFLLQGAARDLVNEKLQSTPLSRKLPDDPASPLFVHTNHTINRNSSVSALVFEAAPGRDLAHLATMWVILGQPVSGVAVPVWPGAGEVPSVTTGTETAPLNDVSKALTATLYHDRRGQMTQYLDVTRLRTTGGEGILSRILGIENDLLKRTAVKLGEWEKVKPLPADVAKFQETAARGVFEALKKSFPDITAAVK